MLVEMIALDNIIYMLIPLIIVGLYYRSVTGDSREVVYATLRMVFQLVAVGFALIYIFENDSWYIGFFIILFMITMSSFIALRNLEDRNTTIYFIIFFAIAIAGTFNLVLVIKFALDKITFYEPRYVIPLAGMIYANSMNAISIAAERLEKDIKNTTFKVAKVSAFKSSMIPKINTFLAVGIVSLPGMMTGQILSGVDPLVAVRYQIVVMAMIFGSAGMSVMIYLTLLGKIKYGK